MFENWNHTATSLRGIQVKVREGFDHPLIPTIDPHYVWPELAELVIAAVEQNQRVFAVGPASCGKSSLFLQIGAAKRQPVTKINVHRELAYDDFIGCNMPDGVGLKFHYGVLPRAMMEGHILLLEELDAMPAATAFVLQSVLEPGGLLLIPTTGEYISPHPDFRICATANTGGFGDSSGLYTMGTNLMNHSQLDRWGVVVEFDYLPLAMEAKLLKSHFPNVESTKEMCQAAECLRQSWREGNLQAPITLRSLLAVCWAKSQGWTWPTALKLALLGKSPKDDASTIFEVFQRFVGFPGDAQ